MSFIPTYGPEDAPRLEETPGREDAPDTETSAGQDRAASLRRIPNIGHALVFVCFTGVVLVLLELVLVALGRAPGTEHDGVAKLLHPKLQIALLATTYLTTLLAAWIFYPLVWQRRFLDGLQWRWAVARNQAAKLVSLGLLLGVTMQAVTYFITPPKTLPVDDFFHTQTDAWLITLFGTIVAPIFEEVCFRGFLLPAFAIAYDWLSLPRTAQARARWQTTTTLTPAALIFSAVLTSIFFALMHFQQVAHLWAALLVLFSISLLLTFVRVRTGSVAASVLVHGAYNGFVFLMVIVQTGGYLHLERMTK
jgi:membrane protease YdiL (CAAX protease family)